MIELVSNLPPLGKVAIFYSLFIVALLGYFRFEVKRSPTYKDDNMRERIADE